MGRMQGQRPVQSASALNSQADSDDSTFAITNTESQIEGRREAMARAAAALGIVAAATAQDQPALAEGEVAPGKSIPARLGSLVVLPGLAVSWVLFNMLGPGLNQLDGMSEKADTREGKKKFTMPKAAARPPPKKATFAKTTAKKAAPAAKKGGFF